MEQCRTVLRSCDQGSVWNRLKGVPFALLQCRCDGGWWIWSKAVSRTGVRNRLQIQFINNFPPLQKQVFFAVLFKQQSLVLTCRGLCHAQMAPPGHLLCTSNHLLCHSCKQWEFSNPAAPSKAFRTLQICTSVFHLLASLRPIAACLPNKPPKLNTCQIKGPLYHPGSSLPLTSLIWSLFCWGGFCPGWLTFY